MQENVKRKRVAALEEALADKATYLEGMPAGNAVWLAPKASRRIGNDV